MADVRFTFAIQGSHTMSHPSGFLSLSVVAALTIMPTLSGQSDKKAPPLPNQITWKLAALDREPTRVVRTHFDAKRNLSLWILELSRDLDVFEDSGHWGPAFRQGRRTP